jgi:hypothetical protein
MFSKFTTVPVALIATFALVSPAFAETEIQPLSSAQADCPTHLETDDDLVDGAEAAALYADELETDDPCDPLASYADNAEDALEAALDRIEAKGNEAGVAAQVLQALIDGDSPAGLGVEYGRSRAEAAKAAAEQRAAAANRGANPKPSTPAVTSGE